MSERPLTFVLAAASHGPMIVSRNDFNRAPSGGYYGVGFQILARGSYEVDEVAEIFNLLKGCVENNGPGLVVIDAGANIGVVTIEVAKQFGPELVKRVVAFEAQERIYYALAGNIALNNLYNVEAVFSAVGDSSGKLLVPVPDYNKPASYGSLELKFSDNVEDIGQPISYNERNMKLVPLVRIDDYDLSRLDFIKLDVEGMELDALRGAETTLRRCRPIMLIEWLKVGFDPLVEYLSTIGYDTAASGMNVVARPR